MSLRDRLAPLDGHHVAVLFELKYPIQQYTDSQHHSIGSDAHSVPNDHSVEDLHLLAVLPPGPNNCVLPNILIPTSFASISTPRLGRR